MRKLICAGVIASALSLVGCSSLITNTQTQYNWVSVKVDQQHSKVQLNMKDGTIILADVPPEAEVKADRTTGIVEYQNVGLINEPMMGMNFVGNTVLFCIGERVIYAGPFGLHFLFSHDLLSDMDLSSGSKEPPGIGCGLDYRRGSFLFGFNLDQPIAVPKQGIRLGSTVTLRL